MHLRLTWEEDVFLFFAPSFAPACLALRQLVTLLIHREALLSVLSSGDESYGGDAPELHRLVGKCRRSLYRPQCEISHDCLNAHLASLRSVSGEPAVSAYRASVARLERNKITFTLFGRPLDVDLLEKSRASWRILTKCRSENTKATLRWSFAEATSPCHSTMISTLAKRRRSEREDDDNIERLQERRPKLRKISRPAPLRVPSDCVIPISEMNALLDSDVLRIRLRDRSLQHLMLLVDQAPRDGRQALRNVRAEMPVFDLFMKELSCLLGFRTLLAEDYAVLPQFSE